MQNLNLQSTFEYPDISKSYFTQVYQHSRYLSLTQGAGAQFIIRFKRYSPAITAADTPLLFGAKGRFLGVADSGCHKCS